MGPWYDLSPTSVAKEKVEHHTISWWSLFSR